jgi:hypothetical protein
MSWEKCQVCGETRPPYDFGPWDDLHFGYCPQCGHCLGRFMRDPVTGVWDAVPPHVSVGNAYYRESTWGDYYCPRCGAQKDRLLVPKKGEHHAS